MTATRGTVVALYLFTQDDALASSFVEGLQAKGLENEVRRAQSISDIKASSQTESEDDPYLVLLDMRPPNAEAISYLTSAQRQKTAPQPVVVVIADEDDEETSFETYRNLIAGKISPVEPANGFVELLDAAFSENWSIEPAGLRQG